MREALLCKFSPTFKEFQVRSGLTLHYPFTEPDGFCAISPPFFRKVAFFPRRVFSEHDLARTHFLNPRSQRVDLHLRLAHLNILGIT